MRANAAFVVAMVVAAAPAAAELHTWDHKSGWSSTDEAPKKSSDSDKETGTEKEVSFERPERLVLVYEDAKLHISPSTTAPHLRANDRTFPRAARPFIFVAKEGGWVELLSFTTADVGRVAVCPYSGLTDVRIRLFVRESEVAEDLAVSSLPPMLDPVSEYRLDGCRNPKAKREPTAPSEEEPGPILNITAYRDVIGPHLDPLTELSWPSGDKAGVVRTRFALPPLFSQQGSRVCFDRSIVSTGSGDPFRERIATLCTAATNVRY